MKSYRNFKQQYLLLALCPLSFSLPLSLSNFLKVRTKKNLYLWGIFYIIALSLIYPNYDTMLRFWNVQNHSTSSFFEGDPLTNLIRLFSPIIDCYYFFILYWILTLFLFYESIIKKERLNLFISCLVFFGLSLTNLMNLNYFTFATCFSLYSFEKYKERYFYLILVIIISYLLHPGILMVLMPSVCLYFLFKREMFIYAIFYCILFYIFCHILFHGYELNVPTDFVFLTDLTKSFDNYTNLDNVWGGLGMSIGIKHKLWNLCLWIIFIITGYYAFRNYRRIFKNVCFSYFIISIILLLNVIHLYTMSERIKIVAIISACSLLALLDKDERLSSLIKSVVSIVLIGQFFLSAIAFPHPRADLFKEPFSSYEVTSNGIIVPSFLLVFDVHHFGFNDEYLKLNGKNRVK